MQFRLHLIAACAAGLLTAGLVLADKPDWAGHDRHEKKEKKDKKDKPRNEAHESWRAEAARAPGPG
ncbi:MAG: hypothetical protein N2690_08615, partial [Rhodocyclaceae bacterium]|nr:hypothetical protein [Rhodocyclaceae bacterium]